MKGSIIGMLVLTAAAVAVMGAAAPVQPSAATQVTLYVPFNPAGLSIGLAVTRKVSGSCFAGSAASSGRSDAWRCSAGNAILDPCYQGFQQGKMLLACPDTPWSANVVLMTPTKALPDKDANKDNVPRALPWALELANGMKCELLTGATWGVAGMRANYGCADNAYVIGDPDRTLARWRVFFQGPRGFAVTQVGVLVAWY
ncbi:MAG TPA: hypothetical protein VGK88_09410 [bacterium]|jgi:hypothetical protein